ncbi:cytochrome P450 [Guyanagaster necrorhizus]|uniref:Cytochrome P450 n=1 Tax=Guyanagaster necrorhizus TaxID=856835 RepID=A0A9P8ANT9_9AGAR|nr:cytochrome P450 [Guyanagaster necrorhizus MCA 3950]KAG7442653.1 cytochrome P450 [Guyanagaster necrorhizus MCA 3950]
MFRLPRIMAFLVALWSLFLLSTVYLVYKRLTRISLANIPGPQSKSFLYGNLLELLRGQASDVDFKWQAMYGDIIRVQGHLGEDRLLVLDPKALQYIYHTSGYRFIKPPGRKALGRLMTGPGILFAEGDDHKRHRKVLLPGFGGPEAKFYVPVFFKYANKMASKWKELISTSDNQSVILDIPSWVSRATLDAIGEAAFDYQFGALDDSTNPLTTAYTNLLFDTFTIQTDNSSLLLHMMERIPQRLLRYLAENAPVQRLKHVRMTNELSTQVAKKLLNEKKRALVTGESSRDIMSLLVKANVSENPKTQLDDEELLAQMNTIILAGHETTANAFSWTLLELSKRPEVQERLRAEIRAKERLIFDRGDTEFTVQDLDSMAYLTAVVKEVLRFHPVVYNIARVAARDDVLPLSKPVTLTTGKVVQEVPIPKGTFILASVAGYNKNKEIWGEDAHAFNPERWFRKNTNKEVSIGVYGNLFSFAGGSMSCIGWRFAVLELHAFLIEVINNFEFSMTTEAERVRREACSVMTPTVEGEVEKGSQLPLRVAIASR